MRIKKPQFHLDSFISTPRVFENDLIVCFQNHGVQEILKDLSKKYTAPSFRNDGSQRTRALADHVAHSYFKSADKDVALSLVKTTDVQDEVLAEWKDEILKSRSFHLISCAVVDIMCQLHPDRSIEDISSLSAEMIVAATIEAGKEHDRSRPIDGIKGINTVCAYVPLPEEHDDATTVFTSFWSERSSAATIKPDAAFLSFLKLANISTDDWKSAVYQVHDIDVDEPVDDDAFTYEIERRIAWENVYQESDESRPSLVDAEELVYAIDNCPFGFTPLVAFNMPVEDVITRDWNAPIKVTGGILGLHDFISGSGDPLRFEGEVEINPSFSNMMAAGARSNSIGPVHGFVEQSFRSHIEDISPENCLKL